MKPIVLLTDFGLEGIYAGVIKGVISSINPGARLIDLTHQVCPHDIKEGAFLLKSAFNFFPKSTVFLAVVDPRVGSGRKALAVKTRNYFFIGPDNGLLFPAAEADGIKKIISLENKKYFLKNISSTFAARDLFSPAVAYLSAGRRLPEFGPQTGNIKELKLSAWRRQKGKLEVNILYIDRFGNMVTDLENEDFFRFCLPGGVKARLKAKTINKFYKNYSQAEAGEPFFTAGSSGYLEISLKEEKAKDFFKLNRKEKAKVFIDIK